MCKKIKNFFSNLTMQKSIVWLVVALFLLVIVQIVCVASHSIGKPGYKKAALEKIYSLNEVNSHCFNCADNRMVVMHQEDFEKLVEIKGIESNDYLAIILTLITLCVSLSAVIPYIVGKSVTDNQVKETVNDIMKHQELDHYTKYSATVRQLENAEAHLARMTAYNLLCQIKGVDFATYDYDDKSLCTLYNHPYWAIGWAAKSIIRYVKVAAGQDIRSAAAKTFCGYCYRYIIEAHKISKTIDINACADHNPDVDMKGIALRAFIDLFDALGFYHSYRCNDKIDILLDEQQQNKLNEVLKELYHQLYGLYPNVSICEKIADKSKYDSYLKKCADGIVPRVQFETYFADWLGVNGFKPKFYR